MAEEALNLIKDSIITARKECKFQLSEDVEVIAVSKFQPVDKIRQFYEDTGHLVYGENYVNEVVEKATLLPKSFEWHFIGHLQSNKVKQLVKISNLKSVHSVSSTKLAKILNSSIERQRDLNDDDDDTVVKNRNTLDVFVQVNTSKEPTKDGLIEYQDVRELCNYIITDCPWLRLLGLMTVPTFEKSMVRKELIQLREWMASIKSEIAIRLNDDSINNSNIILGRLSMGMSDHLVEAVQEGSTHVRVGTALFGARKKVPNNIDKS